MNKLKEIAKKAFSNGSKTRIIFISLISIVMVLSLLIGSTYSIFVTSNVDEDLNVYQTGVLDVTYTLSEENVSFSSEMVVSEDKVLAISPYRITVSNVGNVAYKFNLILTDTTATDKIDSQYIMTKVGKLESNSLADCTDNIIKEGIVVPANDSAIIDIRVYLSEDIQNSEIGKSFYSKLSIDGLAVYNDNDDIDNSILQAPSTILTLFNANGGTVEETEIEYAYGEAYGELPTPTREGYTFSGWYTAASGGTQITSSSEVTTIGEQTLYAIWTAEVYTVSFEAPGGTVTTTSKEVPYGEVYGELPTPTKEGYTFVGWTLVPDEYQQVEYIQSSGTQHIDTGYYWQNENIKIHFDGTVLTNDTYQSLFGNEEYTSSEGTVRNFAGIPHGINGSYGIYVGSTSQMTISAPVGTRFNLNIQTTTDKKLSVYKDGSLVGSTTYSGSVLTKDTAYISSSTSTNVGSIFLFANHNSNRGATNDATQIISSMRVNSFRLYDNNILVRDLVPCYRKSDNVVGMYDGVNNIFYQNSGSGTFSYGANSYVNSSTIMSLLSDHTLYANWTSNTYTVTLNNQNATTAGTTSTVATYESAMPSITVPTKTNYTFTGYYSTTTAVEVVSTLTTLTTTSSRISLLDSSNGWLMTSDDAGTHLQGVITITDSSLISAPTLDFNDKSLTESHYTVIEESNGVWNYYIDFDITSEMLTPDSVPYDTEYRFIDINNITTNSVINVNYLTKGGKKYYDDSGNSVWNYDVASNTTLYAGWKDTIAPTASVATTTTLKSTSQTATLTCSDSVGVTSYYWGTSSSPAASDFTSGTPSTKSVTSAGTYYLFCKDAAGNVNATGTALASGKVIYYSYTVNNLLETVAGTTGTYTSANYTSASSASYIAPSGTSLTLASIYTTPTGASASTFKGYSTSYSTSAASLSTTTPTVASGATYYMWFNRTTYALTLNKGTGVSSVSGAGTYKYGKQVSISATPSTGYNFGSWTVTSGNTPASTSTASTTVTITQATTLKAEGTAKTFTVTFNANGGSVSTASKTVTYASTYGDLPTPTYTGYTFNGWFTATSGGTKITSSSTVSITAAQTLYAQWTATFTSKEFAYTGDIQTWTVPATATYKLEVWGAQGGAANNATGGYGGYSYGNVSLTAGSTIYIVVGGQGGSRTYSQGYEDGYCAGGYNGGGNSYTYKGEDDSDERAGFAGGGGATHIGTFNSTLAAHGSTSGLYIVAGGGGGGYTRYSSGVGYAGGAGGGTSGGDGSTYAGNYVAKGGSQTAAGSINYPDFGTDKGGFGKGDSASGMSGNGSGISGGGGGLYGGGAAWSNSGGGGSGYVGGCISGTTGMTNGSQSGNGKAKITLVS